MSAMATCNNPECGEEGKMKCSGCTSVSYCSQTCQKKHWASHKALCKTLKAAAAGVVAAPPAVVSGAAQEPKLSSAQAEIVQKLETAKGETQKRFMAGDFNGSVTCGLEALAVAKKLPALMGNTEVVQLHLNLSSAFMQLQKFPEAIEHSELATNEAELGVKLRGGVPQAREILSVTLCTKTFCLLNAKRIEEAAVEADKALAIAESIYPKNDQRLHKSLRAVAVVREKQGNMAEAERYFLRGYMTLSVTVGPQTNEAQLFIDDLCNMMIRQNDLTGAEKFARINYKALCEKTLDERGQLVHADASSRLSMILRRKENLPEAQELMEHALSIREERLARNPAGIAFTLAQLAAIQEAQGDVGMDVEARLLRALEIFTRTKGQASAEVRNTLNQLRNVRGRRTGMKDKDMEEDKDMDGVVGDESKSKGPGSPSRSTTTTGSKALTSGTRSSGVLGSPEALSDTEELARLDFAADDGMARMMQANQYFETGRYSCAEVLLAQALEIYMKSNGPEDQLTRAAKQNLGVARSKGLDQLWMQVVTKLVLENEERDSGSRASSAVSQKSAESSVKGGKYSTDEVQQIDDYAGLMTKKGSGGSGDIVADALFAEGGKKSGGCIVC
jgi:tetratricopeptide (TPR) repeat protein